MREYKLYLKDILSAIESIEAFIEDMNFEDFQNDDKTISAVIRKFEIIGEASKKIPDTIKKQSQSIPWKEMAGMRDKLIHSYFGVNYGLVWKTIKGRLPDIKISITQILENFNE